MAHRNRLLLSLAGLTAGISLLYIKCPLPAIAFILLASFACVLKNRKSLFFAVFLLAGIIASYLHLRIPSNDIQRIAFPNAPLSHHSFSLFPSPPVPSPPAGEISDEKVEDIGKEATFAEAEGEIISARPYTFATSYIVKIRSVYTSDGKNRPSSGKILLKTKARPQSAFIPGTRLKMSSLSLKKIPSPANPYAFDYRSFMARRGVHLEGKAETLTAISCRRYSLSFLLHETKSTLKRRIEKYFAYFPNEKALIETITLGAENIPDFLREAGIRSGTYHILVISGSHFVFIILFLKILLFPFARINNSHPKFFPFFSLLFMWFYAGLTGFQTPVVRAVLMLSFFNAGEILERDIDGVNSIIIAAILMLLINPFNFFDASFQLSFIATAGILLFFRRFNLRNRNGMQILLLSCFAAQLAVFPILLYHFGLFYPIGLVNNLVFLPFSGVILTASLISLIFPFFFIPLRYLLSIFLNGITVSSQLSPFVLKFYMSLWLLLAFYGISFLVFYAPRKKNRTLLLSAVSCFFLLTGIALPRLRQPRPDRLYFLSFSKPSALYAGENSVSVAFLADHYRKPEIEEILSPLLKEERIKETALFYTTSSYNHTGTLKTLRQTTKVQRVYEYPVIHNEFSFPYDNVYFYRVFPDMFKFLPENGKTVINGLTVELLGEEKDMLSYAISHGETCILIAPCLGEGISEKLRHRQFDVVCIWDVRTNAATRKNLDTTEYRYLILPRNLKKFSKLPPPDIKTFYLNDGAVKMDFASSPFRISRFYQ